MLLEAYFAGLEKELSNILFEIKKRLETKS
jgi:hypothetical protein